MLPACGGGSSSSTGASPGGGNFEAGRARGTAETLSLVLADLTALRTTLSASGAPAQTSRGTLGRSFALLEPRQQMELIAQLNRIIDQVTEAQRAAAEPGAGATQAEAAQTAAQKALAALRLVVVADTAARAGGGAAAREAAVTALTQIADVTGDETGGAEQQRVAINDALTKALADANERVADLEAALAAAAGSGSGEATIAGLTEQLAAARREANNLRSRPATTALAFGNDVNPATRYAPPVLAGGNPTGARAVLHQRKVHAAAGSTDPSNAENEITVTKGTRDEAPNWPGDLNDDGDSTDTGVPYDADSRHWSLRAEAYDRTGAGVPNDDGLEIATAAVPYDASNSRMVIGGASPSTAEFPARGTVYRREHVRYLEGDDPDTASTNELTSTTDALHGDDMVGRSRLKIQGRYFHNPTENPRGATGTNPDTFHDWSNEDATPLTSFQHMSSGGLTMRFGGTGVIFGDLEYHAAQGCTDAGDGNAYTECNDITTGDIQISFGAPSADPYGERAYFWNVAFPSERRDLDKADPDNTDPVLGYGKVHEANTPYINRYELLLSNWAGDPSAGSPRYLRYAAHGLFKAIDPDDQNFVARLQTFHYGHDAFENENNRRPADFNEASVTANFEGHTMAWLVTTAGGNIVPNTTRMRGDVSLTACLGGGSGGSDCTGDGFDASGSRIKGSITKLHYAINGPGSGWTQHNIAEGGGYDLTGVRLDLAETAVSATGTYGGAVSAKGGRYAGTGDSATPSTGYLDGRYEGSLYGPLSRLEAAGTWWINLVSHHQKEQFDILPTAIIGSFGACDTSGSACDAEPPSASPPPPSN